MHQGEADLCASIADPEAYVGDLYDFVAAGLRWLASAVAVLAAHLAIMLGLPFAFIGFLGIRGRFAGRPTSETIFHDLALLASIGIALWLVATWQGMPRRVAQCAVAVGFIGAILLALQGASTFMGFLRVP